MPGNEILRGIKGSTLPVAEPKLTTRRAVRTGEVMPAEALALIEDAQTRLRALADVCVLIRR